MEKTQFLQKSYTAMYYNMIPESGLPQALFFSVLGWPPERNRSIPLYLSSNNTYPIRPSEKHLINCKILVMVHTRTDAHSARMGIRNSWGKFIEAPKNSLNMSIIYLVKHSITVIVNVTCCIFRPAFGSMYVHS